MAIYANAYLRDGRTYEPLYVYYRAPNYYNPAGYYSALYLQTYYDGYGYNFYYQTYGYYEYSENDKGGGGVGWIVFLIILGLCCCFGLSYFKR